MASTMRALVKSRPEIGLWMEEVPVPEPGINDVLVRILKTGICGTDLHIYVWDAWAQRTIPVPMVVGHEFVGASRAGGQQRHRIPTGRPRSAARGIVGLRPLPQLPGRPTASLRRTRRASGVNRPGAFAETISAFR